MGAEIPKDPQQPSSPSSSSSSSHAPTINNPPTTILQPIRSKRTPRQNNRLNSSSSSSTSAVNRHKNHPDSQASSPMAPPKVPYRGRNNNNVPHTKRPNQKFSLVKSNQTRIRHPPETWRYQTEVTVGIAGLPVEITTFDLYEMFKKHGHVEYIEINENAKGVRNGFGKVRFCPPPMKAFWNEPLRVKSNDGVWSIWDFKLEAPNRICTVDSPVSKKPLPEKFGFPQQHTESIDFGFMYEEKAMMPLFTTQSDSNLCFEANLRRRFLEVRFTHYFSDPADLKPDAPSLARQELYKFEIPFVMVDKVCEEPQADANKRVLVISLPSAPFYWRKIGDVSRTHDSTSHNWTDRKTWFRQTDIVYDMKGLKSQSIAIKKKKPLIDLGRWTTYRITFTFEDGNQTKFDAMLSALKDFNIRTEVFDGFKMQPENMSRVWDIIDHPTQTTSYETQLFEISSITNLTFPVRYQLEVCISEGVLSEYNLTRDFIDQLVGLHDEHAIRLLELAAEQGTRLYDPMDIFNIQLRPDVKQHIPDYCTIMRKATITPTMIYFSSPAVETSNRVVRQYQELGDRFLRVQFTDEKGQGRVGANDQNMMNEVYTRVKRATTNGITIGERRYEFLAFGNSQLREHGAYFFASTEHLKASDIRAWMGDFKPIKQIAKHAARLGQCFSTTRSISAVKVDVVDIPDIIKEGHTFSDGCGKISDFLSQMISSELRLPSELPTPSAYQFRLGGCKGVLAVSPDVKLREVHIRPSQRKFITGHKGLEIIRASQFASATLNRQLITILSSLGVEDKYFMSKLRNQLSDLHDAMTDKSVALRMLRRHVDPNQSTLHIAGLILNGFFDCKEPFLVNMLHLWRAWSIKAIKEKARITMDQGAFLIGVVDEIGVLRGHDDNLNIENMTVHERMDHLPEIYLQIQDPEHPTEFKAIEGVCLLARNPSLHPGDIRTVVAVNRKELSHLRNVVVLPQNGTRGLASMCSGGDLDGDDYIILWDQDFTPTVVNYPPMEYDAPAAKIEQGGVEIEHITSFFVNYMKMDRLGTIAHSHLAWSDAKEDGVMSDKCLRLAQLHSMAVDFNKTGEPAIMEKDLKVFNWPHFMEKYPENPSRSRNSKKVLGKLYDAVEKVAFAPKYNMSFDARILNAYIFEPSTLRCAKELKTSYDEAINRVMGQHAIQTEFEIYSTFVMAHAGLSKDYKFHEELGQIAMSLKDRFRKAVYETIGTRDEMTVGKFVAAMYTVTHDEYTSYKNALDSKFNSTNPVLISFPWVFAELLGKLALGDAPFIRSDTSASYSNEIISLVDKEKYKLTGMEFVDQAIDENIDRLSLFDFGEDGQMDDDETDEFADVKE